MSKLIYIARPIDQTHDVTTFTDVIRVVDVLATSLAQRGAMCFRPDRAFQAGPRLDVDARLERVNRAALTECDALVAVVPQGVPSIGVPREIEAHASTGKPWAALTDARSFSLADATLVTTLDVVGVGRVVDWVESLPESDCATPQRQALMFAKAESYDGRLPTRVYSGDAGFDLYAAKETRIPAGQFRDVPCGIRIALPDGFWGRIIGRSSTLRRRRLLVNEGVIDTGWRGPLFAGVQNIGDSAATIAEGERIAQLVLTPNVAPNFRPTWVSAAEFSQIPGDGRGDRGFGSSGV